jgi:hypothetical protein
VVVVPAAVAGAPGLPESSGGPAEDGVDPPAALSVEGGVEWAEGSPDPDVADVDVDVEDDDSSDRSLAFGCGWGVDETVERVESKSLAWSFWLSLRRPVRASSGPIPARRALSTGLMTWLRACS